MNYGILCYSIGYNLLVWFFILILKLSQIWSAGAPSTWLLCSLTYSYESLSTFLLIGTRKYSRVPGSSCIFSPPAFEITHFFKELLSLLVERGI